MSKSLKLLGAINMKDIIFISTHKTLLDLLQQTATTIDYYKFLEATAPFISGAKQCSPSTLREESDEVLVDVVNISKKRDATTAALFTETGLKTNKMAILTA